MTFLNLVPRGWYIINSFVIEIICKIRKSIAKGKTLEEKHVYKIFIRKRNRFFRKKSGLEVSVKRTLNLKCIAEVI